MSGNSCDLNLIALAPQFNLNKPDRISEKSVWGQTISQHPTFWFFIPATQPSTQLEFSLQDRQEEDIYRTSIPTPQQPGIIGIQIPTSQQPLQLDRNYRWTLKAKVDLKFSNAEISKSHQADREVKLEYRGIDLFSKNANTHTAINSHPSPSIACASRKLGMC